nr:hypothetical protein [Sphaerochaetaceae bacterium]
NITAILDLNGKTLKVTGGAGTYGGGRAIKMEAGNLTIKNGTIDGRSYDGEILNPHSSGTGWSSTRVGGCLRVSGGSATLDNVTMYNNDSWGSGIMMESGSGTLTVNNCTFSSLYGTSITCGDYNTETLSTGYNAVTNIYNCTFTQEGIPTDDMNFNAACLASQYGATINVYGDTRATGENAFAIFSSGGEINVYGGTYSAKHYIVNSYGVQEGIYYGVYANVAQVNLYDGTFTDLNTDVAFKFNNDNHNAILITGGTFNVNPYPKVNHETHDVWKNDETSVKYIVVEKNASHEGYNTQVTN